MAEVCPPENRNSHLCNTDRTPSAFICSTSAADHALLRAQLQHIKALTGKALQSLTLLEREEELPAGCAVFPVSSTINVHLEVGSHNDVSALIDKTQAKLTKLTESAAKQRRLMAAEGWGEKASAAVKSAEEEKSVEVEAQMQSLLSSIEQFRRLKLAGES